MSLTSKSFSSATENFDIKNLIALYLKKWKWFVLSSFLAIIMALLYIRYATPEYEATAKIQILEDRGSSPELTAFNDLDIFGENKRLVEDEIEILSSRSNFIELVNNLGINMRMILLEILKILKFIKISQLILIFWRTIQL